MTKYLAQITNPVLPTTLGSGGSEAGPPAIGSLISGLVGVLLIVSFLGALLFLILGGFDWITSGGDKAKLESSRDKITNALVGLVIVGAAWALMTVVGNFLGIQFPNLQFPTLVQQ